MPRSPRPGSPFAVAALLGLLWTGTAAAQPAAEGSGPAGGAPRLARADSRFDAGLVARSLALLEADLAVAPNDFDARWRAARAAWSLGILASGTEVENAWYRRAIAHADRALSAHPDAVESLRWAVASKGSLAVQTGAREAGRLAAEVRGLAERLLELRPADASAHYALAKLEYELLALSPARRVLARMLFSGDRLDEASWPHALELARRAVELDPGSPLFRLGLADILWHMGRRDEAGAQFEAARDLPLRTPVDRDFRARARLQLRRIQEGRDP